MPTTARAGSRPDPNNPRVAYKERFLDHPVAARGPHLRDAIVTFNSHIFADQSATPADLANRRGAYDEVLFPDAIHPSRLGIAWLAQAVIDSCAG